MRTAHEEPDALEAEHDAASSAIEQSVAEMARNAAHMEANPTALRRVALPAFDAPRFPAVEIEAEKRLLRGEAVEVPACLYCGRDATNGHGGLCVRCYVAAHR